jgi:predicted glutamine amidotransferase
MVAHIRYATQGEVSLENVHPFNRVWKGVQMTFCHNGDCPQFSNSNDNESSAHFPPLLGQTTANDIIYHPVGDTDSEAVFCAILNALTVEFPDGLPTLPVLHEFLSILCAQIIEGHPEDTIFNFLLGCGQYTLFAYSWPGQRHGSSVWNGLYYIVRQPPFSTAKLLDTDYEIDFRRVTTPADRVAVITTKPLTEEPGWTEFARGELLMFDKGLPYKTPKCCEFVEQQGRGLFSKAIKAKCSRSPGRRGLSFDGDKVVTTTTTTTTTTQSTRDATNPPLTTSSSCRTSVSLPSSPSSVALSAISNNGRMVVPSDEEAPMELPAQTAEEDPTSVVVTMGTHDDANNGLVGLVPLTAKCEDVVVTVPVHESATTSLTAAPTPS